MQKQKFLTNFEKLQWGQKYFVIAFVFTISITGKIFFGFKADYLEECRISDILTQYLLMSAVLWGMCTYNREVHTVTDPYGKICIPTYCSTKDVKKYWKNMSEIRPSLNKSAL